MSMRLLPTAFQVRGVAGSDRDAVRHVCWHLNSVEPSSLVFVAIVASSDYEEYVVFPRELVEFACPAVRLHVVLNGQRGAKAQVHDSVTLRFDLLFDAV